MNNFMESLSKAIHKSHGEAVKETSAKVLQEKKLQFDNYGKNDWDDEAFPALEPSTVRRKKGEDRPLLRTGKLKDSLEMEDSSDFLSIEAPEVFDDYGRPYTQKAEDYITNKGGHHYFNKISPKEVKKSIDFYIETFVKRLKSHGI